MMSIISIFQDQLPKSYLSLPLISVLSFHLLACDEEQTDVSEVQILSVEGNQQTNAESKSQGHMDLKI